MCNSAIDLPASVPIVDVSRGAKSGFKSSVGRPATIRIYTYGREDSRKAIFSLTSVPHATRE